jgi:hypothetical protein
MGRAPVIYEKLGRPYKPDRQLVYEYQNAKTLQDWKNAAYELWDKYARVVSIGKRELIELCKRNGYHMQDTIDSYGALFWEKFINQLYGIDLSRVTHLPNFSIYIRVMGYLRAMNRDEVRAYINWGKNTQPILESSDDTDVVTSNLDKQTASDDSDPISGNFEKNNIQKLFWDSIDSLKETLTPQQKTMLNLKIKNKFNYEIQNALKMTPAEFNVNMSVIKAKFSEIIKDISKRNGLDEFDYKKLCLELQ